MPVIFIFRDRFKKLLNNNSEDERHKYISPRYLPYLHHTYTCIGRYVPYGTHGFAGVLPDKLSLQGPLSRFREYLLHH